MSIKNVKEGSTRAAFSMMATLVFVVVVVTAALFLADKQASTKALEEDAASVASSDTTTTTMPDGYQVPYTADYTLLADAPSEELFTDVEKLSEDNFMDMCQAHGMTVTAEDVNDETITVEGGIDIFLVGDLGGVRERGDRNMEAAYVKYPIVQTASDVLLSCVDFRKAGCTDINMLKVVDNSTSVCIGMEYTFMTGEETPETATGYGQTWAYRNENVVFTVSTVGKEACAEIPEMLTALGIIV